MNEPKITTVRKVKDPRRVAQGKRLAVISREAKAKKAKERQEHQHRQEESGISFCLLLVPVIVIGVATFGGYCCWKKEEEPVKEEPKEENSVNRVSRIENF